MFCTRARSCARADDAKSCAVGMRNAKPGNHLKILLAIVTFFPLQISRFTLISINYSTLCELK